MLLDELLIDVGSMGAIDCQEHFEWFLCFQEVFKDLDELPLAVSRTVANEKNLLWSVKLVGYHKCHTCGESFASVNSQVAFRYRVVPKHKRGEVRLVKQYGQMCKKCHAMEFITPTINNDDKLYAMECLCVLVQFYFYGVDKEKPARTIARAGGSHFEAGCEACHCGVCRSNPLFRGILVANNGQNYESIKDDNPRIVKWKMYFGDNPEFFTPSFEQGFEKFRFEVHDRVHTNAKN